MTSIIKWGYLRLLSIFCFFAMQITILAFGTSCRTFLYQPQVPEKVKELVP